jgi:hypothetical protein
LVVELLDRVDVRRADFKRFEDRSRTYADVHHAFGDEQPERRLTRIGKCAQTAVRQVNMREAIVAFAPGFTGAFDIAQDCRVHRPTVSGGQECQHARLLTAHASQPTHTVGGNHDSAGTQHETVRRQVQD